VDVLAGKYKIKMDDYKFQSLLGEGKIGGEEVLLVKPLTFMNLVGTSLRDICEYFRINRGDLLVITDDADLKLGRIKITRKGGDAGHLGVRSIIQNLKSENFSRLRIGIGRPPPGMELPEYVLQEFTREEQEVIQFVILRAVSAVEAIILQGIEKAMTQYN
jgi:PTH1 family peptidyl-tRNA hydrolase